MSFEINKEVSFHQAQRGFIRGIKAPFFSFNRCEFIILMIFLKLL